MLLQTIIKAVLMLLNHHAHEARELALMHDELVEAAKQPHEPSKSS